MRFSRAVRPSVAVAALALILAGCTTPDVVEEQPDVAPRDLVLRIGTLLPQTGAASALGPGTQAAAQLAAQEINEAGLGLTVELEQRDSGDTANGVATASAQELIDADVSVIVGAVGEGVSRTIVDAIVDAGIVQISPGNRSIDFTKYADDGLYWRTSATCASQGTALGEQAIDDGYTTLAILSEAEYCDPGLRQALRDAFVRGGGTVVADEQFPASATSVTEQVTAVVADSPDAVAVLSGTSPLLPMTDLVAAGYEGDALYFAGLRLQDQSANVPAGSLVGATAPSIGVNVDELDDFTERLQELDPAVTDIRLAAETYDAVILAALAAFAADSVDGADIAAHLQDVSGGEPDAVIVSGFADGARAILDGDPIDYDGVSGPIDFTDDGDPGRAVVGVYRYQEDNSWERIGDR